MMTMIMKIYVSVKPNSKQEKVEKASENQFKIWVKEPPVDGKANRAVEAALARYFSVPLSSVRIVSGVSSRRKVLEIA